MDPSNSLSFSRRDMLQTAASPGALGTMMVRSGTGSASPVDAKNRGTGRTTILALYQQGWGKFGRVPAAFNALANYGSAIKPHLEEMRTREYERYVKGREPKEVKACKEAWQRILDNIDTKIELQSIKPFLEASGIKEPVKVFPPKE